MTVVKDIKFVNDKPCEAKLMETEQLKEKMEKMMCCENCIYFDFNEPNYCHKGVYRESLYVCSEWTFGN